MVKNHWFLSLYSLFVYIINQIATDTMRLVAIFCLLLAVVSADTQISQKNGIFTIRATYHEEMMIRGIIDTKNPTKLMDDATRTEALLLESFGKEGFFLFLGLNAGNAQRYLLAEENSRVVTVEPDKKLYSFYYTFKSKTADEDYHTVSLGNPYKALTVMADNEETPKIIIEDLFDGDENNQDTLSEYHKVTIFGDMKRMAPTCVIRHMYKKTETVLDSIAHGYKSFLYPHTALVFPPNGLHDSHAWIVSCSTTSFSCNFLRQNQKFSALGSMCKDI